VDERVPTDEQLAAAAAREDSDGPAFIELMRRHRERVWRICYRLMGSHSDAEDAAQEVFLRLFLARGKFTGLSKYSTWVYGVAVRTCLMLRRSRGRRQKRVQMVRDESFQEQEGRNSSESQQMSLELMEMLEKLDEEDRAMLILKFAEDYTYEDLAEIFQRSVSACKMRVSRARERLRSENPEAPCGQ
jgi:RNA polymerase sigma-70 factor (ECF subfamily)